MKIQHAWKSAFFIVTLLFAHTALAITPAEELEKKCIKPKFRDFSPKPRSETLPEAEISFHMNRMGDPNHVIATAKKIPMKVEIVDKANFYVVNAKLPAELKNEFARIHIEAKSVEGDCIGQDGWLLKISGGADGAVAPGKESSKVDQEASPESETKAE
ncbi:MAG: hypothetical protein ACU836_09470 [Gammaproteobacteria bacterium]